jgi:hypothetical protein
MGMGSGVAGGDLVFQTCGTCERMRISSDGSMGFNNSIINSRSFVFRALTSRPIVIEAIENCGVHSMFFRPNNSGYNLISSNYLSGGTYLPLSLSARENNGDLVLSTNGNIGIGTSSINSKLTIYEGDIRLFKTHIINCTGTWASSIFFTDEVDRKGASIVGERTAWDGAPMALGFDTGGVGTITRRMTITSTGAILANVATPFYDGAGAINTKVTATSVFMFSGQNANNSNPRGIFLDHCSTTGDYAIYYKSGTEKFYVNGNGVIYSTSNTITLISSDVNLKTDIKDYDKGLAEILAMKPRYFKYKDNLDEEKIGFIAQEMEQALAGSMIDVPTGLDTGEFHKSYQIDWYPLLVKAIQEQQGTICSQASRITLLESCLGIS